MIEDARPTLVLTQAGLRDDLPPEMETFRLDADWARLEDESEANPASGVDAQNLAYIIYTSGSTGRPKGVGVSHGGVVNRLAWMQARYELHAEDVVLQKTPYSFDVSVWEFFWPLAVGSRLVVAQPGDHREPARLAEILERHGVTTLHFVPSMLQAFLSHGETSCFATLKRVLCSGEALPGSLRDAFFGAHGVELHNLYGPTEASIDVTSYACQPDDEGLVPIGRPIWNTQIYLLDAGLNPVPQGVAGELHIGGAGLARGYINRSDLTAERFVPNPFGEAGTRLYRTGDVARYRADGTIDYLGRVDHQVKIRGFRIELGEIEATLARVAQVREAIVVAREDEASGKRLVAYLTKAEGAAPDVAALRAALQRELPDYMVPSAIVVLDAIPLTPNGKIDRKALPAPDSGAQLAHRYVAPRNATEETLCRIWAEALGVERVGIDDNFFELGGDSLLSVRAAGLAKKTGVALTVQSIYKTPTTRLLAESIVESSFGDPVALPSSPFALISEADRLLLRSGVDDAYPLTELQLGMIYHSHSGDHTYHLVDSMTLRCIFNEQALRTAVDKLMHAHPVLRTAFDLGGFSEPLQLVHASIASPVTVVDLRTLSVDERRDIVERHILLEKQSYFDLSAPPLFRMAFHLLDNDTFEFTFAHHHAILDGWSVNALGAELAKDYFSLLNADAPLSARDPEYVMRSLVRLEEAAKQAADQEKYWERALGDFDTSAHRRTAAEADTSTDRIEPASYERDLEKGLTSRLRDLAIDLGIPIKSLLLAAHCWAVRGFFSSSAVTTGVVFGLRPEEFGADHALGLFLNSLPLKLRLSGGTWRELILAVFGAEASLMRYRYYPLAALQRMAGNAVLFDVHFTYLHYHISRDIRSFADLEVLGFHSDPVSFFGLDVSFYQDADTEQLQLFVVADPQRHGGDLPEAVGAAILLALEAIVKDLDGRYETPLIVAFAERQRVLFEWNATTVDYPREKSLHELFEEQAMKTPDAIAVVYEDASLTYRELNARADGLARNLRRLGVGPDVPVGLCVKRSLEMVSGLLGVLKAGGAYLPLDPDYPAERLAYIIEDAKPALILTQAALDSEALRGRHTLLLDENLVAIASKSGDDLPAIVDPRNLAYVIYTSGSTGKPKGVGVTHSGIVNHMLWMQERFPLRESDRVLQRTSLSFDASVWELFAPLIAGAELRLPSNELRLYGVELIRFLSEGEITVAQFVPSILHQLLEIGFADCTKLRRVFCGGELLPSESCRRFFAESAADIVNLYGPTEASVDVTAYGCNREASTSPIPIGRPISNTQIYLLDDWLRPVPVGVSGELYVGGSGLARGYLNRLDLTAERFVPNPFGEAGTRLYRTGDLARRRSDGEIEFLGRVDHQVKIRGFRIELGEIEAALLRLPQVREAVVVARDDVSGGKRLVAYATARGSASIEAAALRAALRETLPEHMVPSVFVELVALPLTANGKVDRKALPAPDIDGGIANRYVSPRDATQETLCRVWADVLGVERVGIEDNFFELGGHSLLAVTLIERLRKEGLASDVRTLFAHPTPAGLSDKIGGALAIEVPPNLIPAGARAITPRMLTLASLSQEEIDRIVATVPGGAVNVQDIYPLAPLQEGVLFHHLLAQRGDPYLLQLVVACDTRERLEQFLAALQEVTTRHDILRTAVVWEGLSEPMQVVWRRAPLLAEEIELEATADVAASLRLRFDPRQYRVDVRRAPMVHAAFARDEANDRWLLHILAHHLVLDHTTLDVVVAETQAHLTDRVEGLAEPLAFRDFVAQARLGTSKAEHEAYFRDLLGDVEEPTAPFGLLDVRGDGSGVKEARLALDPGLARRIRRRARTLRVSATSLFHTAFAQVVARASGRDDVVFGTVLFGRMHGGAGADRAVGIFINTLPVRARLGGRSVETGVREMQASLTGLLRHEHASLALAQRCSGVAPPAPLFSALLNYRHSPAETPDPDDAASSPGGVETIYGEERTNYPLALSVDDLGEDFELVAQTTFSACPRAAVRLHEHDACRLDRGAGASAGKPAASNRGHAARRASANPLRLESCEDICGEALPA